MIILKFLSVTEELLIIQDQSRAGFGIFGNSRVLKSYRKRSNLGHREPGVISNIFNFCWKFEFCAFIPNLQIKWPPTRNVSFRKSFLVSRTKPCPQMHDFRWKTCNALLISKVH